MENQLAKEIQLFFNHNHNLTEIINFLKEYNLENEYAGTWINTNYPVKERQIEIINKKCRTVGYIYLSESFNLKFNSSI